MENIFKLIYMKEMNFSKLTSTILVLFFFLFKYKKCLANLFNVIIMKFNDHTNISLNCSTEITVKQCHLVSLTKVRYSRDVF